MKSAMLTLAAIVTITSLAATIEPALAQDRCQSLWVQRNSIYKAAGYCFKTSRAISYFGNAGCRYNNEASVPLSSRQRARIAEIRAAENDYGCR
jgi:hypothetical protein